MGFRYGSCRCAERCQTSRCGHDHIGLDPTRTRSELLTGPLPSFAPLAFPAHARAERATGLVLRPDGPGLPLISWLGVVPAGGTPDGFPVEAVACAGRREVAPLLDEHSRPSYRRPGLRGHRIGVDGPGHDWSTAFTTRDVQVDGDRLIVTADDPAAGLALRTEVEALPGGALRIRHTLTNTGAEPYVVDGLDVVLPLPDTRPSCSTSPAGRARAHPAAPGDPRRPVAAREPPRQDRPRRRDHARRRHRRLRLRARRGGRRSRRAERQQRAPARARTAAGADVTDHRRRRAAAARGDRARRGRVATRRPWVFVAAAVTGSTASPPPCTRGSARCPPIPSPSPSRSTCGRPSTSTTTSTASPAWPTAPPRSASSASSSTTAGSAAAATTTAGLGDWSVDADVWPDGLTRSIDHVRALGHAVRPVVRARDGQPRLRPVPRASGLGPRRRRRVPHLSTQPARRSTSTEPGAYAHLLGADGRGARPSTPIDYVKWDHNRDLLEAGSATGRAPAAHRQTVAHYALLDELRRRHPARRVGVAAPPAADASTSACSSACNGSGPRT